MTAYALLVLPSANRVYGASAPALTRAELAVLDAGRLGGRLSAATEARIGGVPYVLFEADGLTDADVAALSSLSALYALYERDGDLLRPIDLRPPDVFEDDLVTTQRYQGKTNEQFTKLLLNVTLASCAFADEVGGRRFRVFDPLCGRGTTLNQALRYGYDAAGMDTDTRDVEAYATFLGTWLQRSRIKHTISSGPVRRDRKVVARRLDAAIGVTPERWKAGDALSVTVVAADTVRAREFFAAGSFDVVVTDAPYGVQHTGRAAGRTGTRSPLELLREALPVWTSLLRPGGAVGIAWNTRVASRAEAVSVLAEAGLTVPDGPARQGFAHRVDQAISRDVLIARTPGAG